MSPSEYEFRCAEMLKANAHNMSADEIERMAYGSGDAALRMVSARFLELRQTAEKSHDEAMEYAIDDAEALLK